MKRAKKLSLLLVVLIGMLGASWSRQPDEPEGSAVYSTSSVKFDFLKGRLEWEMRRMPIEGQAPEGQAETTELYYVDLERGFMGHNGIETPVQGYVMKNIIQAFDLLDSLAVEYTKVWYGIDETKEESEESKDTVFRKASGTPTPTSPSTALAPG